MYSPKIRDDLIPKIYRLGKVLDQPMTRIVDTILRDYLEHVNDVDDYFLLCDFGTSNMTTPNQILRKLKSLDYRQKLIEDIDSLEAEITGYCNEYGTDVLMGYKINMDNGRVTLKKLPMKDQKQLEMELKRRREGSVEYEVGT